MAGNAGEIKKETQTKRISRLIEELKRQRTDSLQGVIEVLERIKSGKGMPEVKPVSLYLDLIETIQENTLQPEHYATQLKSAEELYEKLFPFGEKTPDYEKTAEVYLVLVGEKGLLAKGYFDVLLFSTFEDKEFYLTLMRVLTTQKNGLKIFGKIKEYALEVREYFVDDVSYLSNILRVVGRLSSTSGEKYDDIVEEELLRLRRSNGVYDIDPVRLAQVEKNVSEAALIVEGGRNVLQNMDRKCQNMERLSTELDDKAKEISRITVTYLESKADNAKNHLDEVLSEYEANQKKAAFLEKDILIKQVFSDAESELGKYKAKAKSITSSAAAEVDTIRRDVDEVIGRLRNAAYNDKKIREFAERSREDDEVLKKIEKLSVLNDRMMEQLEKMKDDKPPMVPPAPMPGDGRPPVPGDGRPPMPGDGRPPMPGDGRPPMPGDGRPPMPGDEQAPFGVRPREARPIPAVNPLLDRRVPFKERFALVMKEKERRIAQGEIFHEMFDDVITAVMEDVNPYLIGPSGCGKTYMVKQVGQILNIDCTDIGYINEEYDILGYVTAMGDYNESNFHRLYKYGGIAFCDELDNGNGKATVKLNSFLTNEENAYYFFPGGERVYKHPNFRVIAAGNTDGNGADLNYNTREKIEESVQQRMIPIYVDYDNRVEQNILKDYPAWFAFACAFRQATDHWGEVCGIPAQGIFTTRDAYRIKKYLDNGSFTPEKIMNYEFVQTKELEYLGFLKEELDRLIKKNSDAYPLHQMFSAEVERVRKRGKRV